MSMMERIVINAGGIVKEAERKITFFIFFETYARVISNGKHDRKSARFKSFSIQLSLKMADSPWSYFCGFECRGKLSSEL